MDRVRAYPSRKDIFLVSTDSAILANPKEEWDAYHAR